MRSSTLLKKKIKDATKTRIKAKWERFKAMCFLLRADEGHYGEILDELKKVVYKGRDEYPKMVSAAYELLLKNCNNSEYKGPIRGTMQGRMSKTITIRILC